MRESDALGAESVHFVSPDKIGNLYHPGESEDND